MPSLTGPSRYMLVLSSEIISKILLFCHEDDTAESTDASDYTTSYPSTLSSASLISHHFYRISRQLLFHTPIIRIPTSGCVSSPSVIEHTPQLAGLHDIISANPDIVRSFRSLEIRFQFPHVVEYSPSSPWSADSPLTNSSNTSSLEGQNPDNPLLAVLERIAQHASLTCITLRGITPRATKHKSRLFDTLKWSSLRPVLRNTILDILHIDTIRTFDIKYFTDFPVEELWASGDYDTAQTTTRALRGMQRTKETRVSLNYVSCSQELPLIDTLSSSKIAELQLDQHPYAWQSLTQFLHNTTHSTSSPFRYLRHLSFAIPARKDDFVSLLLTYCGGQLESLTVDCGYSVLTTIFPNGSEPASPLFLPSSPSIPPSPPTSLFPNWQSRFTLHNLHRVRNLTFQTGVYSSTLVRGVHESRSPLTPFTDELYEDWDGSIRNSPSIQIIDVDQLSETSPHSPNSDSNCLSSQKSQMKRSHKRAHRSPIPWLAHILSTLPQSSKRKLAADALNLVIELDVTKVRQKVQSSLDWAEFAEVINKVGKPAGREDDAAVSVEIQVHALIPELSAIAANFIQDNTSLNELRELGVLRVVPV